MKPNLKITYSTKMSTLNIRQSAFNKPKDLTESTSAFLFFSVCICVQPLDKLKKIFFKVNMGQYYKFIVSVSIISEVTYVIKLWQDTLVAFVQHLDFHHLQLLDNPKLLVIFSRIPMHSVQFKPFCPQRFCQLEVLLSDKFLRTWKKNLIYYPEELIALFSDLVLKM